MRATQIISTKNLTSSEKMNEDISFFNQIINNEFHGISKYKSELSESIFIKKNLSKGNSWTRSTLLLLACKGPRDLTNGAKIDVGYALSTFNRKEYHHIFPRKFLKDSFSLNTPEINRLVNFCLLPSGSNKSISDRAPSNYFFEIIPQEQKCQILESNYIPMDDNIFRNDNYKKFCDDRGRLLFEAAKEKTDEST